MLCTVINKEVSYHQCMNECQYFFKGACMDKMDEAYNQALDDVIVECERFKNQYKTFYFQDLVDISKKLKAKYEG